MNNPEILNPRRKNCRPAPPIERLAARIAIDPDTQCHVWQGSLTHCGYGRIGGPNHKTLETHRVAYEGAFGKIPDGLVIDHLCRNRSCCNPAHLEAVTRRENTLRGVSPPAQRAAQTHCGIGHEFTQANTYVDPRGHRRCRACSRAWEASRRERTRKARAALADPLSAPDDPNPNPPGAAS